jgi:hypothetical protein
MSLTRDGHVLAQSNGHLFAVGRCDR